MIFVDFKLAVHPAIRLNFHNGTSLKGSEFNLGQS